MIFVIGKTEGQLDQSIFAKSILSEDKGPPPEINLFNEKNIGETILKLMDKNLINSCHDVSLGGILIAIAKMCLMGKKGIKLNPIKDLTNKFEYFFSEDQGRYIIELEKKNVEIVRKILKENSVHYDELGIVSKNLVEFGNEMKLTIEEIEESNKTWFKRYMEN